MINKGGITTWELCLYAMLAALIFAIKLAMAAIPNIHPVALIIISGTLALGWRMLYPVGVYVLLEGLMFGFGIWWISYLYIWPVLVAVTMLFRGNTSRLFWAAIAAIHGLLFGALSALPYLFAGGISAAISYWVSGIPFDLLHCAGNFLLVISLLPTMSRLFQRCLGNKP